MTSADYKTLEQVPSLDCIIDEQDIEEGYAEDKKKERMDYTRHMAGYRREGTAEKEDK